MRAGLKLKHIIPSHDLNFPFVSELMQNSEYKHGKSWEKERLLMVWFQLHFTLEFSASVSCTLDWPCLCFMTETSLEFLASFCLPRVGTMGVNHHTSIMVLG